MTDDRNNDEAGAGFDDWLGDEPGPATDPYDMLPSEVEEDDESSEGIMVDDTTEGEAVEAEGDPLPEVEDDTADIEAMAIDADVSANPDDETSEIETVSVATISSGNEQDETAEIEVPSTDLELPHDDSSDVDEPADSDDTGELEIVRPVNHTPDIVDGGASEDEGVSSNVPGAGLGFGDLWDNESDQDPDASPAASSAELFDMTQENYLHTATKDHAGLAESIAMADEEDTEQVALAAPIPGLDATVVGFDDVVEAEGHGRVRAKTSGDLVARIVTAIVLIAALGAALLWQPALVALALGVFVLGAGEFYTALLRSGRKPIPLFGFVGIVAAGLGAYFGSALWIPLAFVLIVTALLLFYAVAPRKTDPMANTALTVTVMVWAGLGTYAILIARSDAYRTLVLGVVVTVAAMDIAQYFFGRALGRHKLSPWVSPKKTIEGLLAGIVVALTIGALLHFFPPFELTSGLAVGAAVAVFSPLGDLAMSAAKRSLGLKDMGSVLPGHGGFLDRIDGLLFVIPVAWAIFIWAGIL